VSSRWAAWGAGLGAGLVVLASACGDDAIATSGSGGSGGAGAGETGGAGGTTDGGGGVGGAPGNDFAEPCTNNDDCKPGFCIPEATTGWPFGYCTELCNDLAPCTTPGTQCVAIGSGEFCLRDCIPSGSGAECEAHQQCFDLGNDAGVCGPGCTTDADCPVLGQCDADGYCVEPENCADALDNDQDGLSDCEDSDCASMCQVSIDATCGGVGVAMATQVGNTTGGTALFAGSCIGSGGALEDLYSFTAPGDGLLHVQLSSDSDQGVYVRSTCSDAATEMACVDATAGGDPENVFLPVGSGSAMTVFVDGYLNPLEAGPYTLDLTLIPLTAELEDNGTFGMANDHVAATAFSAAIAVNDNDWIAVAVPGPTSTLRAEIVGGGANDCNGDIDSEIQVLDTDGSTELAFNDDISPFGNFCSRVSVSDLAAGTYFLRVAASQDFCMACTFDYSVIIDVL
jgi:hypothetical protein